VPDVFASQAYAIKLPVFEGPLDLLLYLIEREEMDITTVSLAQVTDQYLAYLNTLESLEVDHLADFMVIAAKLILIKSQALLPRPPAAVEAEEDVGDDLVRQLLAYKQFKQVARGLGARQDAGLRSYVRLAPPPKIEVSTVDLSGVTVDDLLAAVRRALAVAKPAPPVGVLVKPLTVTIRDQIALIERLLLLYGRISFAQLLSQAALRVEIIVTFLAVLELLKWQRIRVRQDKLFAEIYLEAAQPTEMPPDAESFAEESFIDYSPASTPASGDSLSDGGAKRPARRWSGVSKDATFLLLASASPRRRELLALLGLPFTVASADVDETLHTGEPPLDTARRLAHAKAHCIVRQAPPANLVIAADTIGSFNGILLGKPTDAADAEAMLRALRGRVHQVYTAIVVVRDSELVSDLATTDVLMRQYSDDEMHAYIASGDPMDKAAAYAIQHAGFHPVETVSGCFANVMGLPLCHLARSLRKLGIEIKNDAPTECQRHIGCACPVYKSILSS
jgi:MAF protein